MSLLSEKAIEKSTYVATATFTDADGVAVVPDSITWTFAQLDGTVVNGLSGVVVSSPAAAVDIVLSGLDLAIIANAANRRKLLVQAVYDSTEGDNLPLKQECEIEILPLVNVT